MAVLASGKGGLATNGTGTEMKRVFLALLTFLTVTGFASAAMAACIGNDYANVPAGGSVAYGRLPTGRWAPINLDSNCVLQSSGAGGGGAGDASAANQVTGNGKLDTVIANTAAIPPQTYALLTNATSSGSTITNVQGGSYLLDARGTFGGTSIAVQVTNADGTFSTFSTITAAGTVGPFQIGAGSSVKAVVTGGSPSGLYVSLQGIGSGANPNVGPISYSTTDKGGTITTGGTAQAAIASNVARKAYCIQNDPAATEILSVRLNGTASATSGTILSAGKQACSQAGFIDTSAVSVFAATTGHRWFGYEGQ